MRATRAEIVTWNGRPIDAFFYSTCGGRTESGVEVFQLAGASYLKSVSDLDRDGLAYCRYSPRFRWREEYSGDSLEAMLRRTLPGLTQVSPSSVSGVEDVVVSRRTPSGRVDAVEFKLNGRRVSVVGAGGAPGVSRSPTAGSCAAPPSTSRSGPTARGSAGSPSTAEDLGTGSGSASGVPWGARGPARRTARFSRPIILPREWNASIDRSPREPGMSDTIRVGVVGAGAISQVAHLPVLRKLKGVEVAAICDADFPKARALADRFQIENAFDDIEELLGALRARRGGHLHARITCTRGTSSPRSGLGCTSWSRSRSPSNAASAQRVVRAAAKKDRVVMVGMNHRYRSDVQIVRSFVQTGELGDVESVRGELARLPAEPRHAGLASQAGPVGRRRHARSRALRFSTSASG